MNWYLDVLSMPYLMVVQDAKNIGSLCFSIDHQPCPRICGWSSQ